MKIFYDIVSTNYTYPLSKKDVGQIKSIIPASIIHKIRFVRFGCNTKTTQEGRLVQRTNCYDIRINFCLNNNKSLILTNDKYYIEEIKNFGGKVNLETKQITWESSSARCYASYILLHEIGHIIYSETRMNNAIGNHSSNSEEKWCNEYAMKTLNKLGLK